jgi:lipid-binding SYLF domain-containing protein
MQRKEIKMNVKKRLLEAQAFWAIFLLAMAVIASPVPASADDKMEADQLVEKARLAFNNMVADPNMEALVGLMKKGKGVFICPELLTGAFIIGASGGSGVFLVRGEKKGAWNGPAFYTIGEASIGLQIGGQAAEVILVMMTDRGVASLLSTSAKLGVGASVAAGPVGIGASAATANLSADIISFSRAKGLYGGVSVSGAVVAVRGGWNDAYYGKKVDPTDILIRHTVYNPQAAGLINSVNKIQAKR